MSVNEVDPSDASPREALYAVFADRSRDFEGTVRRALDIGVERLGVEVGFLTRITTETQHIVQVSGAHREILPGVSCPLDEAYCRRTIEMDEPLSVQNAQSSERVSDVAFDTFELGCYIGTKVFAGEETFGTLCFAGSDPRQSDFDDAEELFVELIAQLVSHALERREHERELSAQNEQLAAEKDRFQDIAETTFDVIYRIDTNAQFTYVSSAAERVIGYPPDELVGEFFGDYIEESSIQTALSAFERVFDGEPIENVELLFDGKDRPVPLEINARPVVEDDVIVETQGVARDVTTRVEQERTLRVQNRAIEDSQLGIAIAEVTDDGGSGSVVFANAAFESLTGYTRAELTDTSHEALLRETIGGDVAADVRAHVERNEPFDTDVLHRGKSGAPHWVRLSMSPVVDADGDVTHLVQFYQDVTEQERTLRLVDVLNRILRHNLRNDMNVVQGYAESIADTPEAEDAANRIHATATALLDLTERAQELERYTHREPRPTRLDPEALLARVAETHREPAAESTVDVTVSATRDICAGPEFEQAVSELVTNALTHNPAPVHVSLTVSEVGDRLRVEVVDDGRGVSPFEVASVNAGRETALEHGSRLGLWVVNWIVTQYGGSFRIEPLDDGEATGTVASITIQGVDAETPVEAVAQPPSPLFQ